MAKVKNAKAASFVIQADALDGLLKLLHLDGYQTIGPKVRDGAVVLEPITAAVELPLGLIDDQSPGSYRLSKAKVPAYFDFTHGAQSWKRYLFPAKEKLWSATKTANGFDVHADVQAPKYAFIGVRACELNAIALQDKVFADGEFVHSAYNARREQALIVALNCRRAGGTCFCTSMNTGPKVESGFDLALTELTGKGTHEFLIKAGTATGEKILARLDAHPAAPAHIKAAAKAVDQAAQSMGRTMPKSARKILTANLQSEHWQKVAERCLDCANCTLVCPTCFCNTTTDSTSLDGQNAERWRQWDSCFTLDFSYIHGGAIRRTVAERYRQWITHKLAHWFDQFGQSGCVGCGRCITWCPVGIDITQEVRALGKQSKAKGK
jgi:formate hydrogenlyase subunit 6/NADH:ubiquinone oxidoreductase subunit I